ncbi:GvpL/GvpF family gas vesicle protein, partial [Mycobacterium colombiense]
MTSSDLRDQGQDAQRSSGVYVYGIVPADVQVEEHARGVGDPPAKVDVVREGDIAALISDVPTDRPLGTPEDLQA